MFDTSRRQFLCGVGAATLVSSAGCLGSLTGQNELQTQLDSAREATKQYENPKQALKDGFKLGGPYVPGMGWHFSHPNRLQDAAKNGLTVDKPPLLTYLDTEDGLQLAAVEYGLPADAADETPDLFADENADATETWHTHEAATHVFSKPDDKQTPPKNIPFEDWTTNDYWAEFSPPDTSLTAGDEIALNWGTAKGTDGETETRVVDLVTQHPDLATLHAWVHVENPDGVFKPVHPKHADGHSH